jgi:predicted ArsR family transcriptional regulator
MIERKAKNQPAILAAMQGQGIMSPNQIAKRTRLTRVQVTAGLGALEAKRLVFRVRKERPKDESRTVWVWVLTKEGRALGLKPAKGHTRIASSRAPAAPKNGSSVALNDAMDALSFLSDALADLKAEYASLVAYREKASKLAKELGHE